MDDNRKVLSEGWRVGSQTPIDDRLIFNTYAEFINLGVSNFETFRYYDGMKVYVLETQEEYIWKESLSGALTTSVTYPSNITSNGIDYSNKSFNFVKSSHSPSLTNVNVYTEAALPGTAVYTAGSILELPAFGATLENSSLEALPTLQGVTPYVGMKIIVKDEVDATTNGDYIVTRVGDGTTEGWSITRLSHSVDELYPRLWRISSGTNEGDIYEQTNDNLVNVNLGSSGNITFQKLSFFTPADLGSIVFVSENGDDATGTKGDINKPFATLNAARNAASSGDTIYVFPQVIVYDNRNSNGNAWNGRQAEMNLWKDGITYYFCPGVNIKIYNQTVTGEYLYLFRPNGDSYETCTVRGHLKYEQFGTGVDTTNGYTFYFNGLALGTDLGYNFDSEVDYMFTNTTQILSMERQGVSIVDDAVVTKIRIKAREVFRTYSTGNTGAGTWCLIKGGDHQLRYDEIIEKFTNTSGNNLFHMYSLRDNLSKTVINVTGGIYSTDNRFFDIRSTVAGGIINYKVNKSYFGIRSNTSYVGIIIATWFYGAAAVTFNLNSDFEQIANSNHNATLFYLANTTHILNLKGDIITKTATTAGHRIVEARNLSTVNIEGNIIYSGSGATSSNTFYVDHDSVITFKGNISGNFTGTIAQFQKGFINIYDSVIDLNTLSTTAQLLFSVLDTQNHELRLYNSKVIFNNDTVPVFNCNHTTFLASNSQLINIGTGGGISNTVSNGLIQLINTFVIVNSGDAINITIQPLISLNSAVNTSYIAPALDGSISILTTLTY